MEIIKALCVCWKDISEHDARESLEEARKELKVAGRLFVSAVEEEVDIRAELKPLAEVGGGIKVLFGIE